MRSLVPLLSVVLRAGPLLAVYWVRRGAPVEGVVPGRQHVVVLPAAHAYRLASCCVGTVVVVGHVAVSVHVCHVGMSYHRGGGRIRLGRQCAGGVLVAGRPGMCRVCVGVVRRLGSRIGIVYPCPCSGRRRPGRRPCAIGGRMAGRWGAGRWGGRGGRSIGRGRGDPRPVGVGHVVLASAGHVVLVGVGHVVPASAAIVWGPGESVQGGPVVLGAVSPHVPLSLAFLWTLCHASPHSAPDTSRASLPRPSDLPGQWRCGFRSRGF